MKYYTINYRITKSESGEITVEAENEIKAQQKAEKFIKRDIKSFFEDWMPCAEIDVSDIQEETEPDGMEPYE